MCYKAPGPRCTGHAIAQLQRAQRAYSTSPSITTKQAYDLAIANFHSTPAGIIGLREQGQHLEADLAQARRTAQLNAYKQAKLTTTPPNNEDLTNRSEDMNNLVVRVAMSENPTTPPEVLTKLSEDEEERVRVGVAENPATLPEVLTKLSEDKARVRVGVASNPATPPEVLAKLSDDEDPYVPIWVASNPSTPPEVLTKLSDDGDWDVRQNVAEHLSTPPDILFKLSGDEENDVKEAARYNPKYPAALRQLLVQTGEYTVSEAEALPVEWLEQVLG